MSMSSVARARLQLYLNLLEEYVSHTIQANEFEQRYWALHREETQALAFPSSLEPVLGRLWSTVDTYCGDPELADYDKSNPHHNLTEPELYAECVATYNKLREQLAAHS